MISVSHIWMEIKEKGKGKHDIPHHTKPWRFFLHSRWLTITGSLVNVQFCFLSLLKTNKPKNLPVFTLLMLPSTCRALIWDWLNKPALYYVHDENQDGWVIFFFFAKRNIALSVLISKTIFQCIQFASNMTYDHWGSVPFSQSADLSYDIFLYMIFKMTFYASILILTYFGIVSELHLINCFLHQCCPCAVFVLRPVPEGHRSERHSSV